MCGWWPWHLTPRRPSQATFAGPTFRLPDVSCLGGLHLVSPERSAAPGRSRPRACSLGAPAPPGFPLRPLASAWAPKEETQPLRAGGRQCERGERSFGARKPASAPTVWAPGAFCNLVLLLPSPPAQGTRSPPFVPRAAVAPCSYLAPLLFRSASSCARVAAPPAGAAAALPRRWVARISSSPATHLPFLPLCPQCRHSIFPRLPLSSPLSLRRASSPCLASAGLLSASSLPRQSGGPSAHPEPT